MLTPKGLARARAGHLWIYRSDIAQPPAAESGSLVRVVEPRGGFVAWAHYGRESEISLRLLTRDDVAIDRDFWRARLQAALAWRRRVVAEPSSATWPWQWKQRE